MTTSFSLLAAGLRAVLLAALCLALGAPVADAADVYITASFKADPRNPNAREFINTTPWGPSICGDGHIPKCEANGLWSVATNIGGTKTSMGTTGHQRDSAYFIWPEARTLTVREQTTGAEYPLEFKVTGVGFRFGWTGGTFSDDGMTSARPRNCTEQLHNSQAWNRTAMRLINNTSGVRNCSFDWLAVKSKGDPPYEYNIIAFDIVYALTAQDPLKMRSGVYTGRVDYSVGGLGADFDLGDGVALTDNSLSIHFELTVEHAFTLDIPPGSERAILAPDGGWSQWSEHGRVPRALRRQLPFMVSSSGRFGVSLRCEFEQPDGRCGIRNRNAEAADAPLDIQISMPGLFEVDSGAAAVDVPLTLNGPTPVFGADHFVLGRSSWLKFLVQGEPLRQMLDHPGSHYSGDVTVVFDADP